MPRPPKFNAARDKFLSNQAKKLRSSLTVSTYRSVLKNIGQFWTSHAWPEDPKEVTAEHVLEYLDHVKMNYRASTQSNYVGTLIRFLAKSGNEDAKEMELGIEIAAPDVTWLSVEEAKRVLALARKDRMEIYAAMVLMLYLGLRSAETLAVKLSDIEGGELRVVGKGRKERRIPLDAATRSALAPFVAYRRGLETSSHLLLVYKSRGKVRVLSGAVLRYAMASLGQQLALHLSPHVMRRSFGRHLWDMGVPLETIRDLYGHATLDMTIRYLGLKQGDLAAGLARRPEYL